MIPHPQYFILVANFIAGTFQLASHTLGQRQRNIVSQHLNTRFASRDFFMDDQIGRDVAFRFDSVDELAEEDFFLLRKVLDECETSFIGFTARKGHTYKPVAL